MSSIQPIQPVRIPESLRVVVTLAQLLERLERSPGAAPDQYRSVVRHLGAELARRELDAPLDAVLKAFPATAELYENLRYEHAGLCRSPMDAALIAEMAAVKVLQNAAAPRH